MEYGAKITDIIRGCIAKQENETAQDFDVSENTDVSELWSFVANTLLTGIICIFGLSANLLSFYILGKDQKTPINILLRSLAVFDSMFLACMFTLSLKGVYKFNGHLKAYHDALPYMKLVLFPLSYLTQTLSTWCIVLVTVYRFVAITKPIWSTVACTNTRAKIHVLLMSVAAVIYNIPRAFEFRLTDPLSDCLKDSNITESHEYASFIRNISFVNFSSEIEEMTKPEIGVTSLYNNHLYKLIYLTALYDCFMYVIPISLLVVMNTLLIKTYRNANIKTVKMIPRSIRIGTTKRSDRKDKNITRMIIGLVTLFIACVLPDVISQILMAARAQYIYDRFVLFSNLCLAINSSMNFVVYCFLAGRFRYLLYQTIKYRRCGKSSKYRGVSLTRRKTFTTDTTNA